MEASQGNGGFGVSGGSCLGNRWSSPIIWERQHLHLSTILPCKPKKCSVLNFFGIDEYLTSQKCPKCHEQLKKMKSKDEQGNTKFIHGILQCTHCNITWNRDAVGGLNMAAILAHQIIHQSRGSRPSYLERPSKLNPLSFLTPIQNEEILRITHMVSWTT